MRYALPLLCSVIASSAFGQSAAPSSSAITYPSVAAALAALEARDGKDTVVVHADGWTIVNEPKASAQWQFTPRGHYAYPAVVRRVIKRASGQKPTVETSSLCEASSEACSKLLAEFASMNERITQAVAGRRAPGAQPGR